MRHRLDRVVGLFLFAWSFQNVSKEFYNRNKLESLMNHRNDCILRSWHRGVRSSVLSYVVLWASSTLYSSENIKPSLFYASVALYFRSSNALQVLITTHVATAIQMMGYAFRKPAGRFPRRTAWNRRPWRVSAVASSVMKSGSEVFSQFSCEEPNSGWLNTSFGSKAVVTGSDRR